MREAPIPAITAVAVAVCVLATGLAGCTTSAGSVRTAATPSAAASAGVSAVASGSNVATRPAVSTVTAAGSSTVTPSGAATGGVKPAATGPLPRPKGGVPLAGKIEKPPSGALLGVFAPPAPFDPSYVDSFESLAQKDVSIVMWYQAWGPKGAKAFDTAAVLAIMRRGKVPMITWEPWNPGDGANQSAYSLNAIKIGKYDAYIRQWARKIRRLGGPVMLRPMHEMNGAWYPWGGTANGNTASDYIAAWQRMHRIFEDEGATNVTWVWSVNQNSRPATPANSYAAYYPGAKYVDWTAISGFNFGTFRPYSWWQPFLEIYTPALTYLRTLGKPICIAEFGSLEKGGRKASWIRDAYGRIRSDGAIGAVVWFNFADRRQYGLEDWRINTSASSLAAFRDSVSPSYFVGGGPSMLTRWSKSMTRDDWRRLLAIDRVY